MPPYVEAAEALVGSGAVTVPQENSIQLATEVCVVMRGFISCISKASNFVWKEDLEPGRVVHIYNLPRRRKGQKTHEFKTKLH